MKIALLFCIMVFPLVSFAEKCAYLEEDKLSFLKEDEEGWYNYHFSVKLCQINEDAGIHKDILEYITGIKDTEDKTLVQLIREVGHRFCRGQFGNFSQKELEELNQEAREREWENATDSNDLFCNINSYYHRFLKSCTQAIQQTVDELDEKIEKPSSVSFQFSFGEGKNKQSGCEMLAEQYIMAYKEVAMEEVARYHAKIIENSNSTYFIESQNKMKELTKIWDMFTKIFANIARSFEGFTKDVFKRMASSGNSV